MNYFPETSTFFLVGYLFVLFYFLTLVLEVFGDKQLLVIQVFVFACVMPDLVGTS